MNEENVLKLKTQATKVNIGIRGKETYEVMLQSYNLI